LTEMAGLPTPPRKVVVDESISESELERFRAYARREGLSLTDWLLVKERHRGMPDSEILHHLLDTCTVLLTRDRPFHNTVLSKGLQSYFIDEHNITSMPLSHIRVRSDLPFMKKDRPLRDNYAPASPPLRALLLPESAKTLKRLTTARRRIRNHFGGLENLDTVAVIVSWRPLGVECLLGVRIQVSSTVGLSAILASESYVCESLESGDRGPAALCHALVLIVQLLLHSPKVVVYHDRDRIPQPPSVPDALRSGGFASMFGKLQGCFEHLTLAPVAGGRHLEALRLKLDQLAKGRTNEIQPGRLVDLMRKVSDVQAVCSLTTDTRD